MKKIAIALLATMQILPLAAVSGYADSFPTRKAGQWEITVQSSRSGTPPQTIKQCIDAKTDEKMMQMGNGMASQMGAQCSKMEIKRQGDTYITDSECQMMGVKMVSRGTVQGDFESAYTGKSEVTYTPPLMGINQATTTISAKWLGACAADQRPGDMVLGNGMKVNIEMLAAAGKSAMPRPPVK